MGLKSEYGCDSLKSTGGMIKLAAGDGNRVWFPEMIEALRSAWNESMPFPKLIELSSSLDAMFQRGQPRRQMLPLGVRCPACGRVVSPDQQGHRISVRATILTLGRFGIASPELTRKIEKEWAKYRTEHGLDVYGHTTESVSGVQHVNKSDCTHDISGSRQGAGHDCGVLALARGFLRVH